MLEISNSATHGQFIPPSPPLLEKKKIKEQYSVR